MTPVFHEGLLEYCMPYRLQIVTPEGYKAGSVTCISSHFREEYALQQVEAELLKIVARGRKDLRNLEATNVPKAFMDDALVVLEHIPAFLEAKVQKAAYALWRQFADFWDERGVSVADWWGDLVVEKVGVDKALFYKLPKTRRQP